MDACSGRLAGGISVMQVQQQQQQHIMISFIELSTTAGNEIVDPVKYM
jgi:hypothetical protein